MSPKHVSSDGGTKLYVLGIPLVIRIHGRDTGGAVSAVESHDRPGGGPPPHIHHREEETFYVLEGALEIMHGDRWLTAGPGDFVFIPRGVVHRFLNAGTTDARAVVTFTPAGMEGFFRAALERVDDPDARIPDNLDEVIARSIAAAPRYGMEIVTDPASRERAA